MSQNPLAELVLRYGPRAGADGPVLFVREMFGVQPDKWQERVLRAYGAGERKITIRSAHGVGKSALAAWLVVHMLATKYPQKTVATAPSASQLKGVLTPEVKMWLRRLPDALQDLFDVKAEGIYLKAAPEASYFEARTARAESPEALQGVHSDHVLLIADEASGVPEAIFEAAVGSMSGHNATTLLLGNPVRSSGLFFLSHNQPGSTWMRLHVTGVPGTAGELSARVSAEYVEDVAQTYGRDSNAFRVRALGEFPKSDLDTVIPFELVESARKRDLVIRPNLKEVWGLDVARFGDDSSALVRRNSMSILPDIEEWHGLDLMQTTGRVKAKWDETPVAFRPEWILVDVIGMGGGVVDRLRELKLPVRGVNVSESASANEKYFNLRTELWFMFREWLETRDHKLPECEGGCGKDCLHEKLAMELVGPRFKYSSSGKMQVEPKADMKKRGVPSPNVADAAMLTMAADPASLIHGTKGNWQYSWNEPIRRNRAMV
jgi:phage terminase large subunit